MSIRSLECSVKYVLQFIWVPACLRLYSLIFACPLSYLNITTHPVHFSSKLKASKIAINGRQATISGMNCIGSYDLLEIFLVKFVYI